VIGVVAVPFFNTAENRRHHCVKRVLETLRKQVRPPHVIVPVDNGSTDTRCWEWLRCTNGFYALRIPEPMSISRGVNTGWRPWEDDMLNEKAVGIKFDSDMIAAAGWLEKLLAAIKLNNTEMWNGKVLGQVGLRVARHPDPPPDDAPRGPGGIVEVPFVHGACVARTPIAFAAIGYEWHPFYEKFLPAHADMSLPWGRWGYGDHWTQQRLRAACFYSAILPDVRVTGIFGDGSISRRDKAKILGVAQLSRDEAVRQLDAGEIGYHQEFDGYENPEEAISV